MFFRFPASQNSDLIYLLRLCSIRHAAALLRYRVISSVASACRWHGAILNGLILKIHIVAAVLSCVLLQSAAAAADLSPIAESATPGDAVKRKSPLEIALTVKKIVMEHGKENRLDASRAEPGDILEYRTEYKNIGAAVLTKISATLPLPEHTTFMMGSAYPKDVAASTRTNKDVFAPLTQKDAIESEALLVSARTYGALRWSIEKLVPGQAIIIGARVRVDGPVPEKSQSPQTIKTTP